MIDKDIKFEINKKLNQGISKTDIYDEFKNKVESENLKKFLASRPSYELKVKFKKMHLILSTIWGLFILLELIGLFDLDIKYLISLIISIYITIHIWKFDGRFFLPGIIWFVFALFNLFTDLPIYQYDPDFDILLLIAVVYSLILVLGIYLMYYIRKNVFSYFKWFQPEIDKNEEIKFK